MNKVEKLPPDNKPSDCTGNCDIREGQKIDNFVCKICEECYFIFEYKKIGEEKAIKNNKTSSKDKKAIDKKERENKRQLELDKNVVGKNRKEKKKFYKQDIDIKSEYNVVRINPKETHEWLIYKHYARRVPQISEAFGLFNKLGILLGVVTYGSPCRSLNNGYGVFDGKIEIKTYELNRLCVDDKLPKNCLSYFVSKSLDMLVKKTQITIIDERTEKDKIKIQTIPVCVVSYADSNNNHHGYIYQATNWIYTGETEPLKVFFDTNTNKSVHARTIVSRYGSSSEDSLPKNIEISMEEGGKFRYFKFLGDKKQVKEMMKNLSYEIEPYPKGKNDRYDSSHKIAKQMDLFGREI